MRYKREEVKEKSIQRNEGGVKIKRGREDREREREGRARFRERERGEKEGGKENGLRRKMDNDRKVQCDKCVTKC